MVAPEFPGSCHVRDFGLARVPDERVWEFARSSGRLIVTKDVDFNERSILYGHPPKVIWIRRGNCSTREIATLLTSQHAEIIRFHGDDSASVLELY